MGKVNPNSIRQRCLQVVLSKEITSVANVIGAVGKYVTAANAMQRAKMYIVRYNRAKKTNGYLANATQEYLVQIGQGITIREILCRLCKAGKIRRLSPGVYTAPLPKLFEEEKEAS